MESASESPRKSSRHSARLSLGKKSKQRRSREHSNSQRADSLAKTISMSLDGNSQRSSLKGNLDRQTVAHDKSNPYSIITHQSTVSIATNKYKTSQMNNRAKIMKMDGRPSDSRLKSLAKDLSSIRSSSKVTNNRVEEQTCESKYPSNSYLKTPPYFKAN